MSGVKGVGNSQETAKPAASGAFDPAVKKAEQPRLATRTTFGPEDETVVNGAGAPQPSNNTADGDGTIRAGVGYNLVFGQRSSYDQSYVPNSMDRRFAMDFGTGFEYFMGDSAPHLAMYFPHFASKDINYRAVKDKMQKMIARMEALAGPESSTLPIVFGSDSFSRAEFVNLINKL